MVLMFYIKERMMFSEAYEKKLSDYQAKYIFKRLRNHYKFRQTLRFRGYRQGGNCGSEITLSHNPSLGILAHEVSHAIMKRKNMGSGKKPRFHSKRHLSIMKRVLKYCDSNLQKWLEMAEKKAERSRTSLERKTQKKAENEAKKRSVSFRLLTIENSIKKWETKRKRAENALKKLNRRKKNYQHMINTYRKGQEALKIIREKNCRIEHIPEGIEVFPPEGHNFDGELNSMICIDWDDVMERLKSATIEEGEII